MALSLLFSVVMAGEFRFLVPPDVAVVEEAPAEQAAFMAAQTGAGFGLKLGMEIKRGEADWRDVPLSTPICHEDQVALTFTPSEAGHVTVINQGTTGETVLLFPYHTSDDGRFYPEKPARFPEFGGFTVDSTPGEEGILLFVSPEPLSYEALSTSREILGWQTPEEAIPAARVGATREMTLHHLRDLGPAPASYAVVQGESVLAFTLSHTEPCGSLP